jgi:uncharacterized protein with FMN-binding domain
MRLLIALASTAAGLAALLSFKTHSAAAGADAAQAAGTQAGSTSASAAGGTGSAGTASTGSASSGSGTGSASSASGKGTAGSAGTTLTGAVENTGYGPMQVQVTLLGKKITGVKVLQQTNDGINSQQIDANAIPQLNRETLAAQSARIDAVSGASYTSGGYIKSLQSALDKANA